MRGKQEKDEEEEEAGMIIWLRSQGEVWWLDGDSSTEPEHTGGTGGAPASHSATAESLIPSPGAWQSLGEQDWG